MILALQLSHFSAAAVFAFFVSIVFGICFRSTEREMVRYGATCFAWMVGGLWVAGWVMWLLHR